MLNVKHLITFSGPSPFAMEPVVVAAIDLPGEYPYTGEVLRQGCRRLQEAFPEWIPAEFPPDLPPGEQIGTTIVQWALGALNEVRGFLHDTGSASSPDGVLVWIGYHHPRVSIHALELGLNTLKHACLNEGFCRSAADPDLASFWQTCREHHPDYQACILMEGARSRGIPFLPFIPQTKYWQFGWGCRSEIFYESSSNADGVLGFQFQHSKILSKNVFEKLGFPTPAARLAGNKRELEEAAEQVGWPCVLKPISGGKGKGVTVGIRNMSELERAFDHTKGVTDRPLLVERFVPGYDHRLTIIGGKLTAVTRRNAPFVTGDGKSTILELIENVNRERTDNLVKSRFLCPVPVDETLLLYLSQQGMELDTIPASEKKITLRANANISTGGSATDVSSLVHPDVRKMAETIAKTMGLSTAGVDYITEDIGKPWCEGGAIIEINSTPGLDVALCGGANVIELSCRTLGNLVGRIPFQLVIAGEPEIRAAAENLRQYRFRDGIGWTCCGFETQIGNMPLSISGDGTWPGILSLLINRLVTEVIAVCTPEQIMRNGLPVDRVERTCICGDLPLIDEWVVVLEECSGSVVKFSSWDECFRILKTHASADSNPE
ncbi:MAG: ATP-grasp domain-containing protein [Chlorobiaceae bacterium]|nr:ATP-grasp domain-containing protein [Chlorobiaceae bacterium]